MRSKQRRGDRSDASRDAHDGDRFAGQIDPHVVAGFIQVLEGGVGRQTVSSRHGDLAALGDDLAAAADNARQRTQANNPGPPISGHLNCLSDIG